MNISQHRLVDDGHTLYNVLHFKGYSFHAKGEDSYGLGNLFHVWVKRLEKRFLHNLKVWLDSYISGNRGYLRKDEGYSNKEAEDRTLL